MKTYTLLNGTTLDLRDLSQAEQAFLRRLQRMADRGVDCFDIERAAVGHGSPALRGRPAISRGIAEQPLYLAAEDIATRAGIRQGLILAPEFDRMRSRFPVDGSNISAAQAAEHIGISRAAVYKAIGAGTLQALRIGNVTVVNRQSAAEYRRRREKAAASRAPRGAATRARSAHG
ncbi:MAG: helix-turn-helix domain-containing protein [Planctomycetia bacterium]|nr:helix-turn-helix domain-containing protein [Planctomycetia bacterium]